MWLNVYTRLDGVLVVVPALFQVPVALERTGPLHRVGAADLDLAQMPDSFVDAMGALGYAEASGDEQTVILGAVERIAESARRAGSGPFPPGRSGGERSAATAVANA